MPQSMSKSQIQRFVRMSEDQGIRVTRTKKGLLLRFPDGSSTVQHFTNSDSRAEQNQISRFRRAGMTHPNDTRTQKDTLPAYITSGTISPKTRQRIIDYIVSQGFPETVLSSTVVKDLKMDPGWANRALYHTGFRPGTAKSKRVGRPWYTPEEILCMKDQPEVTAEEAAAEHAVEMGEVGAPIEVTIEPVAFEPPLTEEETTAFEAAIADITEKETAEFEAAIAEDVPRETEHVAYVNPGKTIGETATPEFLEENTAPPVEDLQFIDTRDSWTVDLEELLGEHLHRMVKDRLGVLRAVGIEYEMRVWRK